MCSGPLGDLIGTIGDYTAPAFEGMTPSTMSPVSMANGGMTSSRYSPGQSAMDQEAARVAKLKSTPLDARTQQMYQQIIAGLNSRDPNTAIQAATAFRSLTSEQGVKDPRFTAMLGGLQQQQALSQRAANNLKTYGDPSGSLGTRDDSFGSTIRDIGKSAWDLARGTAPVWMAALGGYYSTLGKGAGAAGADAVNEAYNMYSPAVNDAMLLEADPGLAQYYGLADGTLDAGTAYYGSDSPYSNSPYSGGSTTDMYGNPLIDDASLFAADPSLSNPTYGIPSASSAATQTNITPTQQNIVDNPKTFGGNIDASNSGAGYNSPVSENTSPIQPEAIDEFKPKVIPESQYGPYADGYKSDYGLINGNSPLAPRTQIPYAPGETPLAAPPKPGFFDSVKAGLKEATDITNMGRNLGRALPQVAASALMGQFAGKPNPADDPSYRFSEQQAQAQAERDRLALGAQKQFTADALKYGTEDYFRQQADMSKSGAVAQRAQQRAQLEKSLYNRTPEVRNAILRSFDNDSATAGVGAYNTGYLTARNNGLQFEQAAANMFGNGAGSTAMSSSYTNAYNRFNDTRNNLSNLAKIPFEQSAQDAGFSSGRAAQDEATNTAKRRTMGLDTSIIK